MRKSTLLLILLTALVLSGCSARGQVTQAPYSTSTGAANQGPAPTVVLTVPAQSALAPVSGCTVVSQKPTPGPTQPTLYPSVSDSEWTKGPANAKVTIIEYSDFQ